MKLRNLVYWSNVWSGRRWKYCMRNYAKNKWQYRKYAKKYYVSNTTHYYYSLFLRKSNYFLFANFEIGPSLLFSISICHCNCRFIICQGNISMCQHMSPWSDIQYAEWYLFLTLSFFWWYMIPEHDPTITFDTNLLNLFLPSLKFRHSEIFHSHRGQKTASCICLWNLNICCNWKKCQQMSVFSNRSNFILVNTVKESLNFTSQ